MNARGAEPQEKREEVEEKRHAVPRNRKENWEKKEVKCYLSDSLHRDRKWCCYTQEMS